MRAPSVESTGAARFSRLLNRQGILVAKEEIAAKLNDIIAESLGVSTDEIQITASFIEDLGADSLDIVELVMAIEKEFSIEIPDEDAEKIATVQDAIYYVENHLA